MLYSFHMYEPYAYTTRRINNGRFSYPGTVEVDGVPPRAFDFGVLREFFQPVRDWAARHSVSASRILVGEFGCDRMVAGATQYLSDLIEIFDGEGWHWAFYAFREDVWPAMDYELGTSLPGQAYWDAVESDTLVARYAEIYGPRRENPVWDVLRRGSGPAGGPNCREGVAPVSVARANVPAVTVWLLAAMSDSWRALPAQARDAWGVRRRHLTRDGEAHFLAGLAGGCHYGTLTPECCLQHDVARGIAD